MIHKENPQWSLVEIPLRVSEKNSKRNHILTEIAGEYYKSFGEFLVKCQESFLQKFRGLILNKFLGNSHDVSQRND